MLEIANIDIKVALNDGNIVAFSLGNFVNNETGKEQAIPFVKPMLVQWMMFPPEMKREPEFSITEVEVGPPPVAISGPQPDLIKGPTPLDFSKIEDFPSPEMVIETVRDDQPLLLPEEPKETV